MAPGEQAGTPGAAHWSEQYGRGRRDAHTGLYEWYEIPDDVLQEKERQGQRVAWSDILSRWALVENDLQDRGIDVDDRTLMRRRSWRWLETRIVGLLSADTRLHRSLAPEQGQDVQE